TTNRLAEEGGARGGTTGSPTLKISFHGHRPVLVFDGTEAVALVETGEAFLCTEADRAMSFLPGVIEQGLHELATKPASAPTRHDGDRQLGRLLVDEPEARLAFLEHA